MRTWFTIFGMNVNMGRVCLQKRSLRTLNPADRLLKEREEWDRWESAVCPCLQLMLLTDQKFMTTSDFNIDREENLMTVLLLKCVKNIISHFLNMCFCFDEIILHENYRRKRKFLLLSLTKLRSDSPKYLKSFQASLSPRLCCTDCSLF